jgi:uncharacterized membrane protein
MKKSLTILLQLLIALCPVIYFLIISNSLPASLPIHYNIDMIADKYGSKTELVGVLAVMFFISIGSSLLLLNISKFDPKQRYAETSPLMVKFSWTVVVFLALISAFIVYQTASYVKTNSSSFSGKYIIFAVCLLFTVIGNFMNNIKPNYFVGIRTPWNLEDPDNWRKTHHFSSKIWFFGGLILFVLTLLFPVEYVIFIFLIGLIPMVLVPFWYSYKLFKKKKDQAVI